jgi:hypothetical protein
MLTYHLIRNSEHICRSDGLEIPPFNGEPNYEQYKIWLAAGNTPLPADPIPNPAIAAIDAQLAEIDRKSIRPAREGDTVYLTTLTAQAVELRTARSLLPKMV